MYPLLLTIPFLCYAACIALPLGAFALGLRNATAYSLDVQSDFLQRHRTSVRDYYQFGGIGFVLILAGTPGLFVASIVLKMPFAVIGVIGILFMILWPVIGFCIGLEFLMRAGDTPPGHCHACGYDLRGTTADICTECGTAAHRLPAR